MLESVRVEVTFRIRETLENFG